MAVWVPTVADWTLVKAWRRWRHAQVRRGDAVVLDGLRGTVTATDRDWTTVESDMRDVDHDHASHGFPQYVPHPTGPLRVTALRTVELVWVPADQVWMLPGRVGAYPLTGA